MRSFGILLGVVFLTYSVHGTYPSESRCQCNGKALYCVRDAEGLRCVKCQGNSEGRHCERCKEGFYQQRAGQSCEPCNCSPTGSQSSQCDSRGQCRCKDGFQGEKCDRSEPQGLNCRVRGGSQLPTDPTDCLPCFCNGHSNDCSTAAGYSVHNITSTFEQGKEAWRAATAQGEAPSVFRWSETHGDLEVRSKDFMPTYFYAPPSFLGNQALSYGQTLSFSLRLDRGVRRPSGNDVVLEGAGLKVAASLGDLRTIVPCAKKITYTFRLDELPGSKWQPGLSSLQFQKLLSNLTAIKIRGTFGENGRGYLDNVILVSAHKGPGSPARWVEKCRCPTGYEGQFCERCAAGFKRHFYNNDPLSSCEPCACEAGSCDPETGECYSSDSTSTGQSCPPGYYNDPQRPNTCVPCNCPGASTCSVTPGTLNVKCDRCPAGTTGSRCQLCANGFHGDPLGERGSRRPCQPCQCNGHVNPRAEGHCDRTTGECLRCLNNTRGPSCEDCKPGFYHLKPTDACKACDCDRDGAVSSSCSKGGQCSCREGYEGRRCHRSSCPSCFDPIKTKIDNFAVNVREIEAMLNGVESGGVPVGNGQMEKAIQEAEVVVADMKKKAGKLTDMERDLVERLNEVSRGHLREDREIQSLAETMDNIKLKEQQYKKQVSTIQQLIESAKQKLQQGKQDLREAEFPLRDGVAGADGMSELAKEASTLAEQHQGKADYIDKTANSALSDAQKALSLMQTAMTGENAVKELISTLKTQFDKAGADVKSLERQASDQIDAASGESTIAAGMLKQISSIQLPQPPAENMNTALSTLHDLKKWAKGNLTAYQKLQEGVSADQSEAETLLAEGKAAHEEFNKLLGRVNDAKEMTDLALQGINKNMDGLDEALESLRGFDDKIDANKRLAEEAIAKLPDISGTIRDAVGTNSKTVSTLDNVNITYNGALATFSKLEDLVTKLEGMPDVLTLSKELERDAGVLRGDVENLKNDADDTLTTIEQEIDTEDARRGEVEQVAGDAASALNKAETTRQAVGDVLQTVSAMLDNIGTTSPVDQDKVKELQAAVNSATARVNQELKPRLRELEGMEARQRANLANMSADIDAILADIKNLENIHKAIPEGCFKTTAIEEA
ncbi:laminin subunit gamma-2 [Engraulis encrasicolus]|uniref:laminin subunit gamma-2 n=1 Tax=Engraulis encrasicolus TaxID=184585 RepID=UPI002FD74A85